MDNLGRLEVNVNKTANTLLIIGVFLICIPLAFSLGASLNENNLPTKINLLISALLALGSAFIIVSEILWRILKKYGTTEERLFYLYNSDNKRFE